LITILIYNQLHQIAEQPHRIDAMPTTLLALFGGLLFLLAALWWVFRA
jgi:hypothetical protein